MMQASSDGRAVPGEILLEASGIGVAFGGRPVLEGVDLALRRGDLISVIGPNGAGKTTLIRVLLGLTIPHAGAVTRAPGLSIGYVPQRLRLDSTLPLTAARFLTLVRRRSRDVLHIAMAEVGLPDLLLEQQVHNLSGGETQRLLLARALLGEPDLLVLDEPASGVDAAGQTELYSLIDRIRRERYCGVLMVSHDLHLVMASTDAVICLNRHVCCSGRPETVSLDPAYQRLFGRHAAETLAVYRHRHDHHHDISGAPVGHECEHDHPYHPGEGSR